MINMSESQDFLSEYLACENPDTRLRFLQGHYEVLAARNIVMKQLKAVLGEQFLGQVSREENGGYSISVMGDNRMRGYLTFHEALHIVLEERGFLLDRSQENKQLETLLFSVQNFVNDFLIEKEIVKKCGTYYGYNVVSTKDKDVLANLSGLGEGSGDRIVCEGLLCVALSHMYPMMKDLKSFIIFSDIIDHPNRENILNLLIQYDMYSLTPESYKQLIITIIKLLTGIDTIEFQNNRIVFLETEKVLNWITTTEALFLQLQNLLKQF